MFGEFEKEFSAFLRTSGNDPSSEYYIPTGVAALMKSGRATVRVLETSSKWFGITYPGDKASTAANIGKLVKEGVYPGNVRF